MLISNLFFSVHFSCMFIIATQHALHSCCFQVNKASEDDAADARREDAVICLGRALEGNS